MGDRSLAASSKRLARASSTMKAVGSLASTALDIAIIFCIVGLCNLIGSNPCHTSSHRPPAVKKRNRFGTARRYTACVHAQNHTKHNPCGDNRRGINLPLNLTMSQQYNAALTTLRAEINWHALRPLNVMASLAETEEYKDATHISCHELQQFQTIGTI